MREFALVAVEVFREFSGRAEAYLLVFRGFSSFQDHLAAWNAKHLGEINHEMFIGPPFHRRGGKADLQSITQHPGDGVRGGKCQDLQHEVRAVMSEPTRDYRSRWARASCNSCSPTSTTIGERSRPPIDGIRRRAGRISGSVRLTSRSPAGF
jgi:hypothetical protein